ncbi:MAG: hypothetical protein MHM6MM_003272 [Cercozoa sp. M6MM]
MRQILSQKTLDVPKGVKVSVKTRKVTVEGPRGQIVVDLSHANAKIGMLNNGKKVRVQVFNAKKKQAAMVRTCISHINNAITGVTQGWIKKMKILYSHFPITVVIEDGEVQVRNFVGDKRVRSVHVPEGTTVELVGKDEVHVYGNTLNDVAQCAHGIQQVCRVRNKDIRMFLDGIYVFESGTIEKDEE